MPAPTPVDVELDAESGCTDVRSFFERLRARTDRVRLAEPGESALVIDLKVSRVGGRVHGELRFRQDATESATRQVDGASCEEVVGVLSLTAALALERLNAESDAAGQGGAAGSATGGAAANADRATSTSPSGTSPSEKPATGGNVDAAKGKAVSPEGTAAVESPDDARANADAPGAKRRSLQVELGAQVALTQVLDPLLALGVGPLVRLRHQRMSIGLSALYWSSRLTNADASTRFRSLGFALSACPWSWSGARASFEPCVLGSMGFLHVTDSSVTNPRAADRSLWGVGALGRARLDVSPWLGLELEAGFIVPLVERRFVADGVQRIIAETPRISPVVGLAAVVLP